MNDLQITVGKSVREIAAEVVDAACRAENGEFVAPESSINFADWETFLVAVKGHSQSTKS